MIQSQFNKKKERKIIRPLFALEQAIKQVSKFSYNIFLCWEKNISLWPVDAYDFILRFQFIKSYEKNAF